jgi:nicotinate-nucleotide adenylyltransferase
MSLRQKKCVGVFGGTFDPVHLGHLIVAEQCREQANLDQVWFIPTARPPHKQGSLVTSFGQRAEMLALAIAGHSAFRIEELEKDRPGPSYTAETVDELQRRSPDVDFFLLLGSDCLADLPCWYDPARIVEQTTLLIVERPGHPVWPADQLRAALGLPAEAVLRQQVVPVPLVDVSSRDLRRRCAEGRSVRYLVPRSVERYIEEKRLYRDEERARPSVLDRP